MHTYKLVIAYDGFPFKGWQKTGHGNSVQEVLTTAISSICQDSSSLLAASRTDAGVHAWGQVVAFSTNHSFADCSKILQRINGLLPPSIRVLSMTCAPSNFHPTTDALYKCYHYTVSTDKIQSPFDRKTAWHVPLPLDRQAMDHALSLLEGEHDFSAFCTQLSLWNRSTICQVSEIKILQPSQGTLVFVLKGNRFLFRMVRNIVGTLIDVGHHKILVPHMSEILRSKTRKAAGVSAPAHGLCLRRVFYLV